MSSVSSSVCIIGAGPYGLSIAAHLKSLAVDFRIFGNLMHCWRARMPKGMFLKSEGCASSLSDPAGTYTLENYCARHRVPYGDIGTPVSREIFLDYCLAFQRDLVPHLEELMVTEVEQSGGAFEIRLSSGQTFRARSVVVATGIEGMAHYPAWIMQLPGLLRSHSADLSDLSIFQGRDVTVIGAGQSALEIAALLFEAGASPRVLVRERLVKWNPEPSLAERTTYKRLRYPRTTLGEGLRLWFYANAPSLFRLLPKRARVATVKTVLGPSGAWWLKDRLIGRVPLYLNHCVVGAEAREGRAVLQVRSPEGRTTELITEHVIAATGYRFAVDRLPFLSGGLKCLNHEEQLPVLSAHFESSVPGLYFAGLPSAYSFGPVMRFVAGAAFTAHKISVQLAAVGRFPRSPAARLAGATTFRESKTHQLGVRL